MTNDVSLWCVVASHHHLVDFDPTGQPLPQFLSTLQQQQILIDGLSITQQLIDCYNNARTNPGVSMSVCVFLMRAVCHTNC